MYGCRGAYKLTHSIIPARLSVCKPYIQLNRSSSWGGWSSPMPLYSRWYRAAGSDSGSPWLNEKLSGLYIRGHRGVLVMQNSRTNWIPPGDTSLSFMELIPTRQENVWRDVRGLRSPRSRDWQMKISSWLCYCKETGRDSEYVIAKLAPAFVTERWD